MKNIRTSDNRDPVKNLLRGSGISEIKAQIANNGLASPLSAGSVALVTIADVLFY
jgi:hypothetical protein